MSLEEAATNINNIVYQATRLLEQLEQAGKCNGNGHHARQNVAQFAEKELRDRWIKAKDRTPA